MIFCKCYVAFQFYHFSPSLRSKMKHVRQQPVAMERATAHLIVQN